MSESETTPSLSFRDLNLPEPLLKALAAVGYENPSPIQAQTIPHLLQGRDVLGQAQTGTGKTAAFALPMLAGIDVNNRAPQALVLAPTRELAIQVAEAFQKYAVSLPGFHVLPIYGGQSYTPQLSALKRGAHVLVGTPGRVMDHLKRGTLKLDQVRMVALDEADEMLNMGFLEDVEWILQQMPEQRQVALFSATMPNQIKRIAQTYLKNPAEVLIRSKTTTAANIRQRYWMVSGLHKMDALTRMLEVEAFDAMIIFARTKLMTEELAEKLEARGYAAAPLNGDIPQQLRERTVQRLRDGQLDIIVATDVAARGLNVERITHVLNYDIPLDIESYVHRIGRTGRAGRSGEAILFVAPREKRMLFSIERATRQPIEHMTMPTVEDVNNQRIVRFKQRITETMAAGELELFRDVVEQYEAEHNVPAIEMAAALAKLVHESTAGKKAPLLLNTGSRDSRKESRKPPARELPAATFAQEEPAIAQMSGDADAPAVITHAVEKPRRERKSEQREPSRFERDESPRDFERGGEHERRPNRDTVRMETYRVAVGHEHQVKPGNLVGAIANEAGIDSRHIGRIEIFDNYSLVDLPEGMPREILQHLKKVWVAGQELRISLQSPSAMEGKPRAKLGLRDAAPQRTQKRTGERDSTQRDRFERKDHPGRSAERRSAQPTGRFDGGKPTKSFQRGRSASDTGPGAARKPAHKSAKMGGKSSDKPFSKGRSKR